MQNKERKFSNKVIYMTNEITQQLAYPGVYQDENKIIPYSPRRKEFDFMQSREITNDKTIKLESMRDMSIDQIVELYKNGFRIEDMSQKFQTSTIATASNVNVSSGTLLLIGAGVLVYILLKI